MTKKVYKSKESWKIQILKTARHDLDIILKKVIPLTLLMAILIILTKDYCPLPVQVFLYCIVQAGIMYAGIGTSCAGMIIYRYQYEHNDIEDK